MFGGFLVKAQSQKPESSALEMTPTSPVGGSVKKQLMFSNVTDNKSSTFSYPFKRTNTVNDKNSMIAQGMQDELDDVEFNIPIQQPAARIERFNTIAIVGQGKIPQEEFKVNDMDDGSFVSISPMIKKTYTPAPVIKKTNYERSQTGSSNNSSRRSKRKTTSLKAKTLPSDFADKVLNLELKIDQGNFNMEDINALLLLYSQAVEFYDGMNDEKYVVYESRIQNMLIKPEIASVMCAASRDPEGYAKKEADKKKVIETQTDEEALKAKQQELDRQKKDRATKLKKANEVAEEVKMKETPHYKESVEIMNNTVKH